MKLHKVEREEEVTMVELFGLTRIADGVRLSRVLLQACASISCFNLETSPWDIDALLGHIRPATFDSEDWFCRIRSSQWWQSTHLVESP
jgi:hypothetical protein